MPQTVKKKPRDRDACGDRAFLTAAIAVETWLWSSRKYYLTSVIIILLAMLPFFARFEGRRRRCAIVLLAVMTAFAVAGRVAFYWAPQFKPVCAIVIPHYCCVQCRGRIYHRRRGRAYIKYVLARGRGRRGRCSASGSSAFCRNFVPRQEVKTAPMLVYGFFSVLIIYGVLL